jgi:beta-phosphoglucomutase
MLKAIIFDCDGVIANTEPLHFQALRKTLADENIPLSETEYYQDYLSFDDKGCFMKAFAKRSQPLSASKISELILRKANYYEPILNDNLSIFPGVADFIKQAASKYPLAIASGARRKEIEAILRHANLADCFQLIVSTEDVEQGKPHPESFLKACEGLHRLSSETIEPPHCLVIEDSIHGVQAAHTAGMLCLAVTNSYGKDSLSKADLIVESLETLSLHLIASLFDSR